MDTTSIMHAVVSHAMSLGLFDSVNQHEPKNAPGGSLICSIWWNGTEAVDSSGLASTTARVEFNVRLQIPMLRQPVDRIDPDIMNAQDILMGAYVGDFTLGGLVRQVDVRGIHGEKLRAIPGYITQDQKVFRVADIQLPLIVNDAWTEAP